MANDPAFLFYPGDYLRDTQNLSEKSQVAYDRIMCEHMRNISEDMNNIGISKKQVDFFIKRLNDQEKEELMFVLVRNGAIYQIEWVALSIAKRKTYSNSRADNRSGKKKKISSTYDSHMENVYEIENEINNKDEIRKIFISSLGKNPLIPEMEDTQQLLNKFGYEKVLKAFKDGVRDGCRKVKTLINRVDKNGIYKTFESEKSEHIRVVDNKDWEKQREEMRAIEKKQKIKPGTLTGNLKPQNEGS